MERPYKNIKRVLIAASAMGLGTGCFKGPGFLKQTRTPQSALQGMTEPQVYLVPTREENGATVGRVSASSDKEQLLVASSGSGIAGASAQFPVGSLAIDTDISLKASGSLVSDALLKDLSLKTSVDLAAAAVSIQSTVAMDTIQPFTLALPLPTKNALNLVDPYENLVVLYNIYKQHDGTYYQGVITRQNLEIVDGVVRFSTRYFGTYQAALTRDLVTEINEVAVITPVAVKKRVHFMKGFVSSTLGEDRSQLDGFRAWVHRLSPARVYTSGYNLRSDISSKPRKSGD